MFTFLLLILFIVFVVVPVLQLVWRVWRAYSSITNTQRKMRDAFNQAANGQSQQRSNDAPYPKKKKIDPNVGEYVSYEELDGEPTYTATTNSATESQVEDADWEEIR